MFIRDNQKGGNQRKIFSGILAVENLPNKNIRQLFIIFSKSEALFSILNTSLL